MNEYKEFADIERTIGVREGFFERLVDEDDWSFVIKLHALLEMACAHLLLFHFQEPALADIVTRLELGNKTTGKIAFLAALGLIGKRDRRYITALSELRNDLVHDIRNSEFNIREWFSFLGPVKQRELAVSFSPFETYIREGPHQPGLTIEQNLIEQANLERVMMRAKEKTKLHIWIGAHYILSNISDMKDYSDYLQWVKAHSLMREDGDDMAKL